MKKFLLTLAIFVKMTSGLIYELPNCHAYSTSDGWVTIYDTSDTGTVQAVFSREEVQWVSAINLDKKTGEDHGKQ